MITAQMDWFNAIRDVLTRNDNADVVDNDQNKDERQDVEVQVVNGNVQQISSAAMEDPVPCDVVDNNRIQDEQQDAEAQVVDDNVQHTRNAATEDPLPADLRADKN
jgi:hypothetical protein